MSLRVGELYASLGLNHSAFDRGMSQVQGNTDASGGRFSALQGIAGGAFMAIGGLAVEAAGKVLEIAKNSVQVGANFEEAMSQVCATMGMTKDQLNDNNEAYKKLKDTAEECGSTTKFSATESAEALNYLALAGYDVDTSVSMLPKVLNLAAAGGMDLASTSDMVTDSLSMMGVTVDGSAESMRIADNFMDQMARTSSKANTSVEQLGEAYKICGGSASSLQGGVQELNTLLGAFANVGYKGSEGGTHLRNVLMALQGQTENSAEALDELGIASYDSNGNLRSMIDVAKEVKTALDGMTDEQKAEMLTKMFNTTDVEPFKALMTQLGDTTDDLWTSLGNCDDACKNMSETMQSNLNGATTSLMSGLEGLQIAIFDCIKEPLTDAVNIGVEAVRGLTGFIKDHTEEIKNFLSGTIEFIQTVVGGVAEGIMQLISPVIDYIQGAIDNLVADGTLQSIADNVMSIIDSIVQYIGPVLEQIFTAVVEVVSNIASFLGPILETIAGLVEDVTGRIAQLWQEHGDQIMQVLQFVVSFIQSAIDLCINTVYPIIQTALDAIKNIFSNVLDVIMDIVGIFMDIITGDWEQLGDDLGNLTQSLANLLQSIWDGLLSIISSIAEGICSFVKGAFTRMKDGATDIVSGLVSGVKSFFSNLFDGIRDICTNIINTVKDKFTSVKNGAVDTIRDLPSAIGNIFSTIADNAFSWGANILDGVIGGIKSMIGNVTSAISDVAGSISDTFKGILGIASPSKVFKGFGKNIDEGAIIGIKSGMIGVKDTVKDLANSMIPDVDLSGMVSTSDFVGASKPSYDAFNDEEVLAAGNVKRAKKAQGNGTGITLNIEHFHNDRQQDIEALPIELGAYIERSSR